ncbi:MAG TPA: acyl-ACP--UDP-N-acetylglucosamine O-acyltransferase [Candidatus Baltobacteraceae bacterium]|nr:acyl-ACP--UDP-N-acetylglucosamine O-acyltransferase [Candidatus Dormibacteraeota bacterium]HVA29370.1 acyl-ACP--UDP-N-acetylglucosamine O-acyltransferase [Candidatus Baltobacteraceae bacterium]
MIHPTAIVHPEARIGRSAEIGPYCVVGKNVTIGERTLLQAHVVINGWTTIGDDCTIYPFTTIGAASQDRKYHGERAYTHIGHRTTIREYVSIQRATGNDEVTAVGDDCLLLAYVHIAHNCIVGNHVTMSNLAQLAGHVVVRDHVTIGGMAGIHQFTRIGDYAMLGGASKVTKDVPPFILVEGNPAEVYGLNSVGLRRAQFSVEARNELRAFHDLLYKANLNVSQAVEKMKERVSTDAGRTFVAFLEEPPNDSSRGILK